MGRVLKTVLFVCYGSGHVRMVLPVAQALLDRGLARPMVLGLTTAAPLVRQVGLPLLQFKDFVTPTDEAALEQGRRLVQQLGSDVTDPEESAAYLGLSFSDLAKDVGPTEASRRYAERGRQAFTPVQTLRRILQKIQPDLVVATNSPRAERAAILAAGELGIPSVCMVDLFAIDEVQWIGEAHYGQKICVLNEAVKQFLVRSGRASDQVVVTGNPAFDALLDPSLLTQGRMLRGTHGWDNKKVLLYPAQTEPTSHPFDGRPGAPGLPMRLLQRLLKIVQQRDDVILCVRPRAGEAPPSLPVHPRVVLTGQDWPLPILLHATDVVVTLNSTVGLEGHLAGTGVVQVLGSVFDHAMPMLAYGIAEEAVYLDTTLPHSTLESAVARTLQERPRREVDQHALSTDRVLQVLHDFLQTTTAPKAFSVY